MLSYEQIAEMMRETWGCASIAPRHAMGFARAVEAEVRKQDDALIRQMLEALTLTERYLEIEVGSAYGRDAHISKIKEYESRLKKHKKCITSARKRLENT